MIFTGNIVNGVSQSNCEVPPMPADTLPKIAAAYIRVSTDDQVEFSPDQNEKPLWVSRAAEVFKILLS